MQQLEQLEIILTPYEVKFDALSHLLIQYYEEFSMVLAVFWIYKLC